MWVITEYCTGGDLRSILEKDATLPESAIRLFGQDVVEGLMYIHSRGVICADLKPSNLLMDACATLKLYDFGLSVPVESAGKGPGVGTPSYMAPELFQGGVQSFSSDLWSLGCVLYEMATGKPPFADATIKGLVERIVSEPVARIDSFSAAFNELVVEGLLNKDPLQRYTWSDVCASDFWTIKFVIPPFPREPAFDEYRRKRKETAPLQSREGEQRRNDVLRASHNAERNMARDINDNGGYQQTTAQVKVTPDHEVDFRDPDRREADREDESPDDTPSPSGQSVRPTAFGAPSSTPPQQQPPTTQTKPDARSPQTSTPPKTAPVENGSSARGGRLTVESLLNHASDSQVKPIVMNSKIERFYEPHFEPTELIFPARAISQLKGMDTKELESFLTTVYRTLSGNSQLTDKYNTLCYLSTLCCDTQLANVIINSSVTGIAVKMMASPSAASNVKMVVATVLGLLVRHATFIHPELQATDIFGALCGIVVDKTNPKVRKRALGCLGELMFYVATQNPAERAPWTVPPTTTDAILTALVDEDEVVRHYAAKTIENVASVPDKTIAKRFASKEVIAALVSTFSSSNIKKRPSEGPQLSLLLDPIVFC